MSHDIEDLLDLIKELEERILRLEVHLDKVAPGIQHTLPDDHWYWEHG